MADTCRACDAAIEWARTTAGKRIPLERAPRDLANIVVEDGTAQVVRKGSGTHVSHFATCPAAEQFRRGRR